MAVYDDLASRLIKYTEPEPLSKRIGTATEQISKEFLGYTSPMLSKRMKDYLTNEYAVDSYRRRLAEQYATLAGKEDWLNLINEFEETKNKLLNYQQAKYVEKPVTIAGLDLDKLKGTTLKGQTGEFKISKNKKGQYIYTNVETGKSGIINLSKDDLGIQDETLRKNLKKYLKIKTAYQGGKVRVGDKFIIVKEDGSCEIQDKKGKVLGKGTIEDIKKDSKEIYEKIKEAGLLKSKTEKVLVSGYKETEEQLREKLSELRKKFNEIIPTRSELEKLLSGKIVSKVDTSDVIAKMRAKYGKLNKEWLDWYNVVVNKIFDTDNIQQTALKAVKRYQDAIKSALAELSLKGYKMNGMEGANTALNFVVSAQIDAGDFNTVKESIRKYFNSLHNLRWKITWLYGTVGSMKKEQIIKDLDKIRFLSGEAIVSKDDIERLNKIKNIITFRKEVKKLLQKRAKALYKFIKESKLEKFKPYIANHIIISEYLARQSELPNYYENQTLYNEIKDKLVSKEIDAFLTNKKNREIIKELIDNLKKHEFWEELNNLGVGFQRLKRKGGK